jgi:hypothetical protein
MRLAWQLKLQLSRADKCALRSFVSLHGKCKGSLYTILTRVCPTIGTLEPFGASFYQMDGHEHCLVLQSSEVLLKGVTGSAKHQGAVHVV